MTTLERIIAQAIQGNISREEATALCEASSIGLDDLYNRMSLTIARKFDTAEMSFEDADLAMNDVYRMMVEDACKFGDWFEFAEPAFSIYRAFDSGEFDRGDGVDPVDKYTRPEIRRLIGQAGGDA